MKKEFKKWVALLCAAVCLVVSVPAVPVQASTVGSLEKTLDLVLVKLGVVCNENGLNSVANKLYDTAVGNVQEFDEYCSTNSLDPKDSSSYDSWCETREYQDRLLDMVMENKYRIAAEEGSDVTLDFTKDDMNDAIHGGGGVRRGEQYTIDEDTVNQMNNAFQSWWSENSEYIIYRIPAVTEIPVSYFSTETQRENLINWVKYLEDSYEYVYITMYAGTKYFMVNIGENGFLLCENTTNFPNSQVYLYDENWSKSAFPGGRVGSNVYNITTSYTPDNTTFYTVGGSNTVCLFNDTSSKFEGIIASTARNEKIWKSVETYKAYDCGQQIVYFSPSYTTQVINNVTYTGDYYCDNSSTYTYTIVQDDVNNIDGDVTDSIVDSVVDQSVANITNNYYYTSSSGDGSGDDSDGDSDGNIFERVLDALGSLIGDLLGLLEELVDLFLSGIVSAIGIVVQGLTTAVSKLRELEVQVTGLTGFLASFFSFVPVDYWDIITALMMISFVVIVIKLFRGK